MGTSVGSIDLDLNVNSSTFKSQMNNIGNTAKQSSNKLSGIFSKMGGAVAAAFAVSKVVEFGKACLTLGSDLAEVQNVVDVTFGSMSTNVNEFAKSAITQFGLSEKVAKEYMGTFGAMSKAFGNGTSMAYEQAEALTGLAGDVASFYNITTDEAFTKLKAVYTGETEALKSLGVVMTQTALDDFALQQGLGKTTNSMSEQEKVALRLAFVQEKLADASGDFARTSDGWANQTRVLALRFDALRASIGQGLINVLTPAIRLLNIILEKLQVVADAFRDFMEGIFGDAGDISGETADDYSDVASSLADGAESANEIKKSLAGFDEINVLSGNSSSGTTSSDSSSGGTAVADEQKEANEELSKGAELAIKVKSGLAEAGKVCKKFADDTGLTTMFTKAEQSAVNVKEGVENLGTSWSNALETNAPKVDEFLTSSEDAFLSASNAYTTIYGDMWLTNSEHFKTFTEENAPQIEEFFGNIQSDALETQTILNGVTASIFSTLTEWWNSDGLPMYDKLVTAFENVVTWVMDIYNKWIRPTIEKINEIFLNMWENNLKPIFEDQIMPAITKIGNFILDLWNNVLSPVVRWLIDTVAPVFIDVFSGVWQVICDVFSGITELVGGLFTALGGLSDFLTGVFTGDWKKAWLGIREVVVGIVGGIGNFILQVVNAVWTVVYTAFKSISDLISSVASWIGDLFGQDWGWELPDVEDMQIGRMNLTDLIGDNVVSGDVKDVTSKGSGFSGGRFATGAYVSANTPQLAIIGDNRHEGEFVAPESKLAQAVTEAVQQANSDKPIYLTVQLGDANLFSGFVDYHNNEVLRLGSSPLLM